MRDQSWRTRIPALAAELGFENHEDMPTQWQDVVEAFVSSTQAVTDSSEDEQQVPASHESAHSGSTGVDEPNDPEQTDDVSATAAAAQISDTHDPTPVGSDVQFHYGHHMLSSFASSLKTTSAAPAATPEPKPTLPAAHSVSVVDLFDHH